MEIAELIALMKEVKLQYPDRSIEEILRLFNIQALHNLTNQLSRVDNK